MVLQSHDFQRFHASLMDGRGREWASRRSYPMVCGKGRDPSALVDGFQVVAPIFPTPKFFKHTNFAAKTNEQFQCSHVRPMVGQ